MATVTIDTNKISKALEFGLIAGVQYLQNKIHEITPRDPLRPPKDPSRKVTGNLKRSLGHEKVSDGEYRIGVRSGYYNAEIYGLFLEYGTIRMAPRSFLRKGLEDNKKETQNIIQQAFSQYIERG